MAKSMGGESLPVIIDEDEGIISMVATYASRIHTENSEENGLHRHPVPPAPRSSFGSLPNCDDVSEQQ
jgi:hypothetical protein